MNSRSSQSSRWSWFSPWLILGSTAILAAILLILATTNLHQEKAFMIRTLLSEANVLISSIEAGSRTGMRGAMWGQRQIQSLVEDMAQQPDVLYVALIDANGRVLAHNRSDLVGAELAVDLPEPGQTEYRFVEGDERAFQVVRTYLPWQSDQKGSSCPQEAGGSASGHGPHGPRGRSAGPLGGVSGWYVIVGMDPAPFEAASRQDIQETILLFGIMFLVGAAGISSLVWAQHYRTTRRSLQQMTAFTETLINQMPVGLLTTDLEGTIQRSNETAHTILKRAKGPNGSASEPDCFASIVRKLEQGETVLEREVSCPTAGSGAVPLRVNAAPIRDGDGAKVGYVLLFSDMTDMKRLEERLRRSERLASLGRLAAGIAHEIRNPLSSIKGFVTIIAGRCEQDERSRQLSKVMLQEVERLNRVVSELLDYARPTEVHRESVALLDLIHDTLRLVEKEAQHQKVKVETSVAPETLEADIDPDRFSQVLLNLYLNALQTMKGGGSLKVSAHLQEEQVLLRVSDTGDGILPEHIPHIFDPYFTTKPSGVGLGLANVHKIVEAHGAKIEVESVLHRGTAFTVRLNAGV
jgi:two-component system, NtrC family, sensor histidine kinase HydH